MRLIFVNNRHYKKICVTDEIQEPPEFSLGDVVLGNDGKIFQGTEPSSSDINQFLINTGRNIGLLL